MAPSLLLQNSVLPTEPDIAAYCREIMEKPDELKKMAEIRESRIVEVEALPDEHVDKFLRACVNALSEERRRGMSSKKKRVVLRHMLEAVREAGVASIIPSMVKIVKLNGIENALSPSNQVYALVNCSSFTLNQSHLYPTTQWTQTIVIAYFI